MIFDMMLTPFLSLSDITYSPILEGKEAIDQVLKLPLERHQIPFLVSKEVLECCSIWGKLLGFIALLLADWYLTIGFLFCLLRKHV